MRVINHVMVSHDTPHLFERQLAWSIEALALAERIGDPFLLFFAADRRHNAVRAGEFSEAQRCQELTESLAGRLDQPFLHWLVTLDRQGNAMYDGDTDRAEQEANDALRIGTEAGEPDAAFFFSYQVLGQSYQRGIAGDLAPLIEQMAADAPVHLRLVFKAGLALAYAEADDLAKVREALEQFAATGFEFPLDSTWMLGMFGFAEAAIECRDPRYAGPIFEQLAPFAEYWFPTPIAAGRVSHYLAALATVLGRFDEADTYFAETAALNDRWGFKFCAARTNLLWARMLVERSAEGDVEKARDLLNEAHDVAAAHGYSTIERRAAEALQYLN